MKSLMALGRRSSLLALVAFGVACGSTTSSATSSGTGGAGTGVNGTGGSTTGASCSPVGQPCSASKLCCGGLDLTCNGTVCVSQSNGTGTGTGGTLTDPCPVGDVDGGCATSIECNPGLLCTDGHCQSPQPSAKLQCTPSGIGPSEGAPCCESTQDAGANGVTCVPWVPCVTQGGTCGAGDTCCNGSNCGSDGTCDPVCGALQSACTTDSDCCADNGSRCVKGSSFTPAIPGSICYQFGLAIEFVPPGPSTDYNYYNCADFAQCIAYDAGLPQVIDCQLGSFCNNGILADGGTDPCAQDGLVCDTSSQTGFCRNPNLFEPCVQGGPPCINSSSTTSPTVCSDPIFGLIGDSLCVNECETTEDCADPWQSCLESQGYADCEYANNATGCAQNTPSDLLHPCDSASTNDGICLAVGQENPSNSFGLCTQAFTDGDGGPGQSCNQNGNRQMGGLCDTSDLCLGNTCGQLCNASSSAAVSCGAGTSCVPLLAIYGIGIGPDTTNDAYTTGACVTPCDFTLQDAGPCGEAGSGLNGAGVPVKCLPAELYGYTPKEVADFCMVGPTAAEAIPLGGNCTKVSFGNDIDPCVAGAICLGSSGGPSTCLQLCEDKQIAKVGAAGGCAPGDTCTALNFTGTASTHTGYCMPPAADGG